MINEIADSAISFCFIVLWFGVQVYIMCLGAI